MTRPSNCIYSVFTLSKRDEGSFIKFPFQEDRGIRSVIRCPNCGNDGMDGSIDAKSLQWGLKRICCKCHYEWSGGIGVQRAVDAGDRTAIGEPAEVEERGVEYTGAPYRLPHKNIDHE